MIVGSFAMLSWVSVYVLAVGLWHGWRALQFAPEGDIGELRDMQTLTAIVFASFALVALLATVACIGFVRRARWAPRVWFTAGTAFLLLCVLGLALRGVLWSQFWVASVLVAASWWSYYREPKASEATFSATL